MKSVIIGINILLGLAVMWGGFQFGFSNYRIATRTDFYNKNITVEDYARICKGHEGDGMYAAPCMYKTHEELLSVYNNGKEYAAAANQRETENTKQQLPTFLGLAFLVITVGLSVIVSGIALRKNKKWGAVGLVIFNLLVLVATGYWALAILLGFGELPLLLMPLAALVWFVLQSLYIKRHWVEFS